MFTPIRSRIRTAALALSAVTALVLGATATTGAAAAPAAPEEVPVVPEAVGPANPVTGGFNAPANANDNPGTGA